jgi:hypothetical protein
LGWSQTSLQHCCWENGKHLEWWSWRKTNARSRRLLRKTSIKFWRSRWAIERSIQKSCWRERWFLQSTPRWCLNLSVWDTSIRYSQGWTKYCHWLLEGKYWIRQRNYWKIPIVGQ